MKRLSILTLLCAGSVFAQAPEPLTLDDAVRIGRENSRTLRISSARVDAAEGRSGAARAALLPSLRFEGTYKRLSDVPPFRIQPPGFPSAFVVSPTVLDNYTSKLTVQQPIFTGFRLSSNARAAEALAEASLLDRRSDEEDVEVAVTTAYLTLYQALETMKVTEENVHRLNGFLRDSENLLNAGMATRNDYLKIQLQLNNARLQQIDATNDVEVARMNLNFVMGRPLDIRVQLVTVPGSGSTTDSTLTRGPAEAPSSLIDSALSARPDVRAIEARVQASSASLTAAQGSWWPQLFLTASYYYNNPNSRYQPTLALFKSTWDLGVSLQLDLWNWGQTSYEADQARANLVQSETLLAQTKEAISLDVRRQFLAVRRAVDKVRVARDGVDQAEENLRTFADKFQNGVATSSDILDADFSLVQARTNLTGALVEQELADVRMKRAMGVSSDANQNN